MGLYKDKKIEFVQQFISSEFGKIPKFCFYKGISSKSEISDFLFTDYSLERESKTVNIHGDIYNLLLNNLPSWKALPKRSKSIIFTDSIHTATTFAEDPKDKYGKVFLVLPKFNASIVSSPSDDIWYSFTTGLSKLKLRGQNGNLPVFNKTILEILKIADLKSSVSDYKSLLNALSSIKESKTRISGMNFQNSLVLNSIKSYSGGIEDMLDDYFSPENNKFNIEKYNPFLQCKSKNLELWTDSDAVLINIKLLDQIC